MKRSTLIRIAYAPEFVNGRKKFFREETSSHIFSLAGKRGSFRTDSVLQNGRYPAVRKRRENTAEKPFAACAPKFSGELPPVPGKPYKS